jgi:hypothetical protein
MLFSTNADGRQLEIPTGEIIVDAGQNAYFCSMSFAQTS